ncbi:MAG: polysulfide reductase NrfD [Anaerolineaceae bacterium]|jgi:Ni/Fe-hydrogenase subunit HybB-like protein|nr:polysulfide reductase NrfD [Anaerolineaceae bacterium]
MNEESVNKKFFTVPNLVLLVISIIGLGLGIYRLATGLGSTTNMSDTWPWAVWITFDIVTVAFSAGGFILAAVVTIFRRMEYHRIALPVILAGFLGELMVVLVLIMDIARWDQFWSVLIPGRWNATSFMLIVALALTCYMAILILELLPVVFKRFTWNSRIIERFETLFTALGIILASIHNLSLGALFLVVPYSLHPLWYTPLLPFIFYIQAIAVGLCGAILIIILTMKAFRQHVPLRLLSGLAKAAWVTLIVYLVIKIVDLLAAGELGMIFSAGTMSMLFWVEIAVGVIAPLFLFGIPKVRDSEAGLLAGVSCTLFGMVLNRTSVSLLALTKATDVTYFPHWIEISIIVASICAAILFYNLALRVFPFLPEVADETR